MKKILIALPLVLVMLLSMVPVMADFNGEVQMIFDVFKDYKVYKDGAPSSHFEMPLKGVAKDVAEDEAKIKAAVEKEIRKTYPADKYDVIWADPAVITTYTADPEEQASATFEVVGRCVVEETTKETVCLKACEKITVEVFDVHNQVVVDTEVYAVDPTVAPDYQAVIELYMNEEFPWHAYQPLKNYLNVYSILTPASIEKCTIRIEVLPKWETIQVIHELYDCCITPDGKVKESLLSSFIEDDEAFLFTGVPDGFMGIPFLEFHTGLMVNQDKAAEYAKTRLEKMNAKDFVFQSATFYDGIRASKWVKGVVNMTTGKVTEIKNNVPTIVIKYLRGECVKNEQKVDNAKVEAGVQTTTNAPAQQLPATGAKDITAFFMSAVALLGLGIFFAKKH